MPVHDCTRVTAGTFHHLHTIWIAHLSEALNAGLLPAGYYAMAEQHAGMLIADILTLQTGDREPIDPRESGVVAVAEAPPRVSRKMVANPIAAYRAARRTIAIRHASGHHLVALLEIVSPANKDRVSSLQDFVDKVHSAIDKGIHLLVVDLFPPGKHDPRGVHAAICEPFDTEDYSPPPEKPLTLVSYAAYRIPEAYVELIAVGDTLSDMPLFIENNPYVNVPLERTYLETYRGVPAVWRGVIEGQAAS
jgi:hypothetical protein